jgi:hypothetical protein
VKQRLDDRLVAIGLLVIGREMYPMHILRVALYALGGSMRVCLGVLTYYCSYGVEQDGIVRGRPVGGIKAGGAHRTERWEQQT